MAAHIPQKKNTQLGRESNSPCTSQDSLARQPPAAAAEPRVRRSQSRPGVGSGRPARFLSPAAEWPLAAGLQYPRWRLRKAPPLKRQSCSLRRLHKAASQESQAEAKTPAPPWSWFRAEAAPVVYDEIARPTVAKTTSFTVRCFG